MNSALIKISLQQIKIALILLIIMTILTGLIYPLMITGLAQLFFPQQANGNILIKDNQALGSVLIGQPFNEPNYFWGRPSATSPFPYNARRSSGSNQGPSNASFLNTIKERVINLQKSDPTNLAKIPVDLVTASGSGLDPEISPLAALYQIKRIAKARNIPEQVIEKIILRLQKPRTLYILGEPRVNVLELNLALEVLTNNKLSQ